MIWYLALEPYRERYTEQLLGWTLEAARQHRVDLTPILGQTLAVKGIRTGPVLDAHGRAYYSLTQMAELVRLIEDGKITEDDWIYLEDLFTPGYEALPYIFDQLGWRPQVAARNWAQSVDPDDFTFAMRHWMRPFEQLVAETVDVIYVASTCHKEMWEAANLPGRVAVVGLPFNSSMVRATLPAWMPRFQRPRQLVYASRLDREKQPHLFMDIVVALKAIDASASIVFCTGADAPRSNDPTAVSRLRHFHERGLLTIRSGLTKAQYYGYLADAAVQLNTAKQDFVSFTACEASAFVTPTLAPAYRSFPEALENRATQLFVPWSVDDAVQKILALMDAGQPACGRLAQYHDGTYERTFKDMRLLEG